MREPANSWEITYVISYKRPQIDLGIEKEEVYRVIGPARAKELRAWAHENFTGYWLKWHI